MPEVLVADDSQLAQDADPDRRLLAAFVAGGDRDALGELFRRHAEAAWRMAAPLVGRAHADDAVQAAFLQVMREGRKFRGDSSVRTWLLRIVINACRMQIRAATRRQRHEAEHRLESPAETGVDAEARTAVLAAVESLPVHYREPIALRFLNGHEFAEVAALLERSEATVRSQVERALGKLRELLSKRGYALSAAAIGTALSHAPADAAPASLANHVAAIAHRPMPAAVGSAFVLKLVIAGAIVAAASIGAIALKSGSGPVAGVTDPDAQPIDRPYADLLDLPITVSLRYDRLPEIMEEIAHELPPKRFLQYAIPPYYADHPWSGLYLEAQRKPVREIFDAAANEFGLTWRMVRDVVVFVAKDSGEAASPNDSYEALVDRARRGSLAAVRALLARTIDHPEEREKWREWTQVPSSSPDSMIQPRLPVIERTILCALADDPVVARCLEAWKQLPQPEDTQKQYQEYRHLELIGQLRATIAVPWLIDTINAASVDVDLKDVKAKYRSYFELTAIYLLGSIGDGRAIDPLIDLRRRLNPPASDIPELKRLAESRRGYRLQALATIGDRRGLETIIADLAQSTAYVQCVAPMPDPEIANALRALLKDPDTIYNCRQGIARAARQGFFPELEADLRSVCSDAKVYAMLRADFAIALGSFSSKESAQAIATCLNGGDSYLSEHAAQALARMRNPAALAILVDACRSADKRRDEGSKLKTLVSALGSMRTPEATDAYIEFVRSGGRAHLGNSRDRKVIDLLIASTDAGAPLDGRRTGSMVLGYTRDPRALDRAIALCKDSDASVRDGAIISLGHIDDERATATLHDLFMHDPDGIVRSRAVQSLCNKPHLKFGRDDVMAAYRDRDLNVRRSAIWCGFSTTDDPDAIANIRRILIDIIRNDPEASVRESAVLECDRSHLSAKWKRDLTEAQKASEKDLLQQTIEALRYARDNDPAENVRSQCVGILKMLGATDEPGSNKGANGF